MLLWTYNEEAFGIAIQTTYLRKSPTSLLICSKRIVIRDDEIGVDRSHGKNEVGRELSLAAVVQNVTRVPGKRWGCEVVMTIIDNQGGFAFNEESLTFNTGKDLLPLKKSGQDGDGGRVNVGSGVDNSNNKSRIWLSEIKQ
ncbi:hypothetical protein Tco_1333588, partial [Tanacetum coccineum]